SLTEFFLGMALGALVGIPLGLLVGYNRLASELLDPLLMAFNATPRVALVPLIVVWFGVGIWAKAIVAFAGAFFPIAVTLAAGLKSVDPSWLRAARSFGCTEGQIFRHILLPGSVPYLMAGLRLGIGRAVIGVIIAEMFAATKGIGQLMAFSSAAVKTNELLFQTLLVSMFAVGDPLLRNVGHLYLFTS
ncbi:MAG TPA: ABC transporter permease, partial [Candidatus Tripitaka californicus]|uniref:ABC transporter permease n=1 Tax=Candidatus Tripitaka californicus TaxID=3367616 RepID=UPI0040281A30